MHCTALHCTAHHPTRATVFRRPSRAFILRYGTESTQSIDVQGRAREVVEVQEVTSLRRRAHRTSSNPTYTIFAPRLSSFIIPSTHAPPSHPVSHFIQSGIPVRRVRPSNWHPPHAPPTPPLRHRAFLVCS
ncbi:hypothetical protein LZ31DRAFT_370523 [Colletotrichum somersetense]|nr:hypothetical protein LZ31DRAFT_370523 [Colletotrichum somersetense]